MKWTYHNKKERSSVCKRRIGCSVSMCVRAALWWCRLAFDFDGVIICVIFCRREHTEAVRVWVRDTHSLSLHLRCGTPRYVSFHFGSLHFGPLMNRYLHLRLIAFCISSVYSIYDWFFSVHFQFSLLNSFCFQYRSSFCLSSLFASFSRVWTILFGILP